MSSDLVWVALIGGGFVIALAAAIMNLTQRK
jgi:hypothetical protein